MRCPSRRPRAERPRHPAVTSTRLLLTAVIVATAAACSSPDPADSAQAPAPGEVVGTATETGEYLALDKLAERSLRFRYLSEDRATDEVVPVSAAAFVPRGTAPAGGWPVIAVGHPTTGISTECAPSFYGNLLGTVDLVANLLELGFVVVQTDYQGLGTPGSHAYLEPTVAARNIIDSVRAVRSLVPDAAGEWWGFGVSQGGHAVFRANEIAAGYGDGLDLQGTISMSPALDIRPIADAMAAGTLTPDQIAFLPLILTGLRTVHPELHIDDYLRGPIRDTLGTFLECSDTAIMQKQDVVKRTTPADYRPVDDAATDRLRGWLGEASLPQGRASAPMMVVYSSADTVILPSWTERAVEQACGEGDLITTVVVDGQSHGILDVGSSTADWVEAVSEGRSVRDSCR
ncbi:lipase family protein [Gordonia westfalica]|uniref:Secretory lipase n=1 Tax=Gordonia westfalica TaxID=158898 RepID=A0A1H2LTA6_9ACTN|nr:lipase family protein [Gordonia westfalica]SDU84250.1 Secretory lipase [Gordonia westfalica]